MTTGATAEVIRLSRAAAADIPAATLAMARLCMLDWFGLAIAGAAEPVSCLLRRVTLTEGGGTGATVIRYGRAFSPRQAALLNGVAGHALDYDDVNLAMHVHPTTVILPPLLALAEARGLGGRALIEAFVAGYEAAGMIGTWLGSAPYDRGFHMTGTVGCLGAAAGCAYLLGLDEEATARAYGLAASQASGLKAQFGTMGKPLHAGRAAEAGLCAALWAEAGLSSRTDILEARQGYAETQAAIPAGPIVWNGYELDRNLFKYHACCFGTHGTIEAISSLLRDGLRVKDVRQVRLKVDAGADRMCNIFEPQSGTEAKFSLRLAAALALAGEQTARPDSFRDEWTRRSDLTALRDRVVVELAPRGWSPDLTEVDITLTDGSHRVARHDASGPTADAAALRRKFALLTHCMPTRSAKRLEALINDITDVEEIAALSILTLGQ